MSAVRCCLGDPLGNCRSRVFSPPSCCCSFSGAFPMRPRFAAESCSSSFGRSTLGTPVKARTAGPGLDPCRGSIMNCCMHTGACEGCPGGNDNDGNNADISGGKNNNNNNNNNGGGGGSSGQGGSDGHGWRAPKFDLRQAMLGAMALTVAFAAFPAPSKAGPGALSSSPTAAPSFMRGSVSGAGGALGANPAAALLKDSSALLSSSAPTRSGGLSDALGRSSVDLNRATARTSGSGFASGTAGGAAVPASPGAGSSPSRPRSKVMHVATKGGTLVVPLPANPGGGSKAIPIASRLAPWQRKKIVEAPIELSEREARMIDSRQNRVRDSLLV